MNFQEKAIEYASRGWRVFPCHEPVGTSCSCGHDCGTRKAKHPRTANGLLEATGDINQIKQWWERWPTANIGLLLSDLVLDVDPRSGGDDSISKKHIPPTLCSRTGSGGWHYVYKFSGNFLTRNGILPGIDIKGGSKGYIIAPPSRHICGGTYQWVEGMGPGEIDIAPAPQWIIESLQQPANGKSAPINVAETIANLKSGSWHGDMLRIVGRWVKDGWSDSEIQSASSNRALPGYTLEQTVSEIQVMIEGARKKGYDRKKVVVGDSMTIPAQQAIDAELLPPPLCEDALALEFARRHSGGWRYVRAWNKWLRWDGIAWRKEKTGRIWELVREVCREVDSSNPKNDGKPRGVKWKTVVAVEAMARNAKGIDSDDDIWDSNPWELNTPRGVVNLKTGELRTSDPADLMTKTATASPEGDCPIWDKFLQTVTDGDDELAQYLARVAGYTLTGVTSSHALFFCYGLGGNGKGVFIDTLISIMGDYFTGLPLDALMETRNTQHSTDLAGLQGARLVSSDEIEKGRRWAKSKISMMTGEGMITARMMRQDFSTFKPQFKLLILGNNKPAIADVDEAIRRRLHLIPFTVTIPKDQKDEALREKLLAERDGILAWAVRGCLDWQKSGLRPPEAVVSATEDYLANEDILGQWISEHCVLAKSAQASLSELYASWRQWRDLSGELPGTLRRLSQDLDKRGFKKLRETRGVVFFGLEVKKSLNSEPQGSFYETEDSVEFN